MPCSREGHFSSSNFQNLFPMSKSDSMKNENSVGFPVLRTISRNKSFPKFKKCPIITGAKLLANENLKILGMKTRSKFKLTQTHSNIQSCAHH